MKFGPLVLALAVSSAPGLLHAQFSFNVDGRPVQIHSFASQGFLYSNNNNFLSMNTSSGSGAMTDFGFNAAVNLTDRFRVGAQFYDRNVGKLGDWRPEADWAMADYKFKDWLGIRGGKVKTALGLYNDTQDLEFLHTWALMPQSVYPVDSRGDTIAHLGGDLYGHVSAKQAGTFDYTLYGGYRPSDMGSGFVYGLETSSLVNGNYIVTIGKKIDSYGGPVYGADLRWTTPLKGLLLGASFMHLDVSAKGYYLSNHLAYHQDCIYDQTIATYAQYTAGNFTFAGEYRKEPRVNVFNTATGSLTLNQKNTRQGYVSAAYRLSKRLEVGAYHSRFVRDWLANHGDPKNHVFDQVITARFDLSSFLDLKVEGHFIDGADIDSVLSRGFFAAPNPNGLQPQMKMLVLRLGFHM